MTAFPKYDEQLKTQLDFNLTQKANDWFLHDGEHWSLIA